MVLLSNNLELQRCPHCSVANPNLHTIHHFETNNSKGNFKRFWHVYVCSKCGGVVIASGANHNSFTYEIFPHSTQVEDTIPQPARSYLQQSLDSLHAPSGAIMLAASAVDAMLKSKGYIDGSLYSRIDKAAQEHLITTDMAKWAHEVRLDANDQRHADLTAGLPDSKMAMRTIDFSLALGQFLFVLPARITKGLEELK